MRLNRSNIIRVLRSSWPVVFLALLTAAIFFTTLVLKRRTFYVFPDNIDQFYAWYQKLAVSLHSGKLPIWDANVSAGHSFVGELQAGVFYPVNLLWVWLFGSLRGISIFWLELIVVFHFWLASVGMYFAARSMGLSKQSGLASGVIYAFGGTVAVRSVSQTAIFFGLCYIPWAFFAFNKWLSTKKRKYLALCGAFLGFILLAGHIQPWYHAIMLISLLVVLRNGHPSFEHWLKTVWKGLSRVVVVVLTSLVIALPQVILTAQYLPHAYRFVGDPNPITANEKVSVGTFTKTYSYKPQDLFSLVDPVKFTVVDGNELYLGLVGLTVVLLLVFATRKSLKQHIVWRRYSRFLVGTMAISTIIMIGYWTFIPAVLRLIPLVSQIRQLARYSILIHFCLSIMVGIGLEVLGDYASHISGARARLRFVAACSGVAAFLAVNSVYLYKIAGRGVIDKHFVYQNAVLALVFGACALLLSRVRQVLFTGIIIASLTQTVWFMPKKNDFPLTYPPVYYRRTPAISYLEQYYGQARVLIEDNALPVNVGDVYNIQTMNGYGATLQKEFFDYINEADEPGNAGQHTDFLNIRFVVSKKEHPELKLDLFDQARNIFVYERPNYLPRAFFANQQGACQNHLPDCTPPKISKYTNDRIDVQTETTALEELVLSEVKYRGWQAYIDGKKVDLTAFAPVKVPLFRATNVPPGKHTVSFRYQPF